MIHAQIVTSWAGDGLTQETGHRPALLADVLFAEGDNWADATMQPSANLPTAPNLLVVECVVSDATFAAILAHPDYGPGAVLWSETL